MKSYVDLASKKICPSCKNKKEIFEFHSKGHRTESICKLCSNARKKIKRLQKKAKSRRKRQKGQTLNLVGFDIMGKLSDQTIEDFGRLYGNLILEVYDERK